MLDFKKIEQITRLLIAEKKRSLSIEEKRILDKWLQEDVANLEMYESLKVEANISSRLNKLSDFDSNKAFRRFIPRTRNKSLQILRTTFRVAAVVLPFLFMIYILIQNNMPPVVDAMVQESLIQPGSSKALLQLADGKLIDLEKEETTISTENGAVIDNNKKEIMYQPRVTGSRKIEYNSIEIPRGGEYKLILSDGTKVWLNSETFIRFPVVFSGNTRELYLSGEAFFEVVEDTKVPFIVHAGEMAIHVTGTSFNVKAYTDEDPAATLITGKVYVTQKQTENTWWLKPGQQAIISDKETYVVDVDVEQFIAWKNGKIYFENNSLEEILLKLSRWYDVHVIYANEDLKNLRFSVDMIRYTEFNHVFEIIELTKKVKFNIEGNNVIVMEG